MFKAVRRTIVATGVAATLAVGIPASASTNDTPQPNYGWDSPAAWAPGQSTEHRYYLWGNEVLFSKNDSKLIVAGTAGAVGASMPGRVAKVALIGMGAFMSSSSERAFQVIENGKCLKLMTVYPGAPLVGTYHCG